MRGLTVVPHEAGSMRVDDLPEPTPAPGEVVVEGRLVGVCGTDRALRAGAYGWAPPGRPRLVIGHESLGVVRSVPSGPGGAAADRGSDDPAVSHLAVGDLVAGIVRRADPVPCPACAAGQVDLCRNGRYTEHGIKELDGFGREVWTAPADSIIRIDPSLGDLGVLLEPTSVVAKGWDQTAKIWSRAAFAPRVALVTGAGPVGLLAAMLGVARGLEVHVLDLAEAGPKPELARALGASYFCSPDKLRTDYDLVMECTGVGSVVFDVIRRTAAPGVVCLLGVSGEGRTLRINAGEVNNELVLDNEVVFGSVNANRSHWAMAADALRAADRGWLARLVSRRVPLASYDDAFTRRDDDIKVVIDLTA